MELEKINESAVQNLDETHKREAPFFERTGMRKLQKKGQFWLKNRNKSVTISLQRHFLGDCEKSREQLFAVRERVVFIRKCAISLMKKLTDDLHFWVRSCIMETQWKVVPLRRASPRLIGAPPFACPLSREKSVRTSPAPATAGARTDEFL